MNDRTQSYRSRAAATLRQVCEASGRTLGELAAILSDRFDRKVGVDELRGWLAGECEFPIAAVATISEIGPATPATPTVTPAPGREPEPAPRIEPAPADVVATPRRRGFWRRPLAVGLAAGALLVLGGAVAQAVASPQVGHVPVADGSAQRKAVTTWSSPTPVATQAPERVALTGTASTASTPSPTPPGGALAAQQINQSATPEAAQPTSPPPAQAAATPAASPSASPTPTPTPAPPADTPSSSPSGAASSSDTSSSDESEGLLGGLLGLLIG